MSPWKKHIWFGALIGGFFLLIETLNWEWTIITSRFDDRIGLDWYAVSAWIACYWQGPGTGSAFDPYPHRSGAILLGALGMGSVIFMHFIQHW